MSPGSTARQASSKSKPEGALSSRRVSEVAPSASPSTSTTCWTPDSRAIAPSICGRNIRSVTTTLLPALANRYSICSGVEVL
jgi:hypothetical protein